MPCRQKHRRSEGARDRQRWLALAFATVIGASLSVAPGYAAPKFGVYCIKHKPGVEVFASKLRPDGKLSFGMFSWEDDGQYIGLFGTAVRQGDHWEYRYNMAAPESQNRCKVGINLRADGSVMLIGDPVARCAEEGGVGTSIGTRHFPASSYEGPVTNELSDPEFFNNNTGKCAR